LNVTHFNQPLQVSLSQQERVLKYIETGKEEGAKVLTGGTVNEVIKGGYYVKPTIILRGTNDMKVFQDVSSTVAARTSFQNFNFNAFPLPTPSKNSSRRLARRRSYERHCRYFPIGILANSAEPHLLPPLS
jgi:hypothetical protein